MHALKFILINFYFTDEKLYTLNCTMLSYLLKTYQNFQNKICVKKEFFFKRKDIFIIRHLIFKLNVLCKRYVITLLYI